MHQKYRIWHPFTQHQLSAKETLVLAGKGSKLTLEDGREVIDGISSWWVNIHGHAHPKIVEAISKQAERLEQVIFAEFTHEPAELLASKVVSILPKGLSNLFFSDSGSTAVEVALKMAYQYHVNLGKPKKKFYSFEGSYHGDTLGAMSVGGRTTFSLPFLDLLFETTYFPYPDSHQEDQVLKLIEESIHLEGEKVAALIIEPLVQGTGGMKMTTISFLQKLEKLLKQHQILLIYDEVMTGFGRTGDFFACIKSNTIPDMICLAKGLTGGFLPLALTVVRDEIYEAFLSSDRKKTFYHGHSYTANPLGCAAAIASFDLLIENQFQFRYFEARHQKRLSDLRHESSLENLRVMGTIAAMDLKMGSEKGYFNEAGIRLRSLFLDEGGSSALWVSIIYLMPPYCISDEELDHIYGSISKVIKINLS